MKQHVKNVVLVHGAFADGSGCCAAADIPKRRWLQGVRWRNLPRLHTPTTKAYTKAAIDAMGGPVVLVGHSYAGSIITGGWQSSKRRGACLYCFAFALDEGESCASIEQALPQASKALHTGQQRAVVDRPGAFRC